MAFTTRHTVLAALAALSLLAAACSSSAKSSSPQSTANAGAGQTTAAGSSSGAVTVETHSGPMGTYLTDGKGMSLYMFASDSSGKSSCTGQCLTYWPPLTGTATASGSANAGMLGTIAGANGTTQVTYGGHPLYTYTGDKSAGETTGQGSTNFGAKWWLLAPSGQPITAASGGAASSSSSSSSGGGGWS